MEQQFLEHRLALGPELLPNSPTPVLAPVPSPNYLRQLLLRGFPAASTAVEASQGFDKGLRAAAQATPPVAVRLSLADPEPFLQRVQGRRLAVLSFYLPPLPPPELPPVAAAELAQQEMARTWAYLRGERSLEVASNRQLLPLFVLEI